MIENMTEADRRRLDRLLRDLSREYGRLTDAGREELYAMHRDLGWALARSPAVRRERHRAAGLAD